MVVQEEGHWRATREILELAIPDTLIGVITARSDKLDESTRQVIQSAAVLGREFDGVLLADVADAPGALDKAILELQRKEIIQQKSRLPHPTFVFKHALTQQSAYDSILLSNRRKLHNRAAKALEGHDSDQAADIDRHWLEARQPAGYAVLSNTW